MKFSRPTRRRADHGYMLLTLMLFVALLAIASLGWIQRVDFEVKRDREEEMIHRGVQYSRAIRRYVKKFGRYPSRIEDLESTNNIRFLRKRYKDPITGKDFKLLHMNDVQISFNPGAASGMPPRPADDSSAAQAGAPASLTVNPGAPTGAGPSSIPGAPQPGPQPGAGAQQNADNSNPDQNPQLSSSSTDQDAKEDSKDQNADHSKSGPGGLGNGPTFGGMPIMGVASRSKEKSIREFNKKDHYNQWQFIYDPSTDRGGLLTTPNQPAIQGAVQINQQQNGQQQNNGFAPAQGSGPGGMNSPSPQPQPQMNQQQ
jgi:type II secretory pathway pseudopilin PulG